MRGEENTNCRVSVRSPSVRPRWSQHAWSKTFGFWQCFRPCTTLGVPKTRRNTSDKLANIDIDIIWWQAGKQEFLRSFEFLDIFQQKFAWVCMALRRNPLGVRNLYLHASYRSGTSNVSYVAKLGIAHLEPVFYFQLPHLIGRVKPPLPLPFRLEFFQTFSAEVFFWKFRTCSVWEMCFDCFAQNIFFDEQKSLFCYGWSLLTNNKSLFCHGWSLLTNTKPLFCHGWSLLTNKSHSSRLDFLCGSPRPLPSYLFRQKAEVEIKLML